MRFREEIVFEAREMLSALLKLTEPKSRWKEGLKFVFFFGSQCYD